MEKTQVEFIEGIPQDWDQVKAFDDIVTPAEKAIIEALERKVQIPCPDLHREGKSFYYCGSNLPKIKERTPSPESPLYQRHVSSTEMQLFCMGDFMGCCYKNGASERRNP